METQHLPTPSQTETSQEPVKAHRPCRPHTFQPQANVVPNWCVFPAEDWFCGRLESDPLHNPAYVQSAVESSLTPAVPARSADLLRAYSVPTTASVLEDVVADLAISVADLSLCHGSDGFEELSLKLRGIAVRAMRAVHSLGELDEQDSLSRSESEVAR